MITTIVARLQQQKRKFLNLTATSVRRNYEQQNHEQKQRDRYHKRAIAAALFSSVVVAKTLKGELDKYKPQKASDKKGDSAADDVNFEAGQKRPDLPVYRAEEISKHGTVDSFWVVYKHGVYDVTKFLPSHPGGEQILNAGGLSIEPFWNVYGMHKSKAIYELLENYRIGNLHDDDLVELSGDELWVGEPRRDPRLEVKSKQPFNAEVPARLMLQSLDTPNELFFVRQHMPVPELEAASHRVAVTVPDGDTRTARAVFSLQQLAEQFPHTEVRAALMCAGNRRTEMSQVKLARGLEWRVGAISCARWGGVLLRDVLLRAGVDPTATGLHVVFTGCDIDATGVNFSTSIPLEQALNPNGRILLATHMNGEVLPRDHGYPIRVVVPGAPAVRSVKWLESVTVSREQSTSHWHQRDYRSFNASTTWETADFPSAPPVYSLPVTSAICDPAAGDVVAVVDGCIQVRGYAYSGGGAGVVRVDVSADGGATWHAAHELLTDEAPPPQHYAWTLWSARVPVPPGAEQVEIWAKATDSNFNTQPEKFDHIWNIRGILGNAYHKVTVNVKGSRV